MTAMIKHISSILLISIVLCVQRSSALRCYSCTVFYRNGEFIDGNPNCNDPFNATGIQSEECGRYENVCGVLKQNYTQTEESGDHVRRPAFHLGSQNLGHRDFPMMNKIANDDNATSTQASIQRAAYYYIDRFCVEFTETKDDCSSMTSSGDHFHLLTCTTDNCNNATCEVRGCEDHLSSSLKFYPVKWLLVVALIMTAGLRI